MSRLLILFFGCLSGVFAAMAGPGEPTAPGKSRVAALYHRADSLYGLDNSTHITDSLALAAFTEVAGQLEKAGRGGSDTMLTRALLKKGILLDAGGNYPRAREAYCRVLSFHPTDDSIVFVAQVLVGTVYYNLDRFDSASYFLLRAEALSARFDDRDNRVRLYNTLGALYCDNGNYRQGKNYFDHALELVKGGEHYDTAAAVSLQINIATASFRVGQYNDALGIYRQLLGYRPLSDYVYENMGRAYAGMDNYSAALNWFRRVKVAKIPGVLNEMAYAELRLHRLDSCAWYLDQLRKLGGEKVHPLDLGASALYKAEETAERGDLKGALVAVQEAVENFSGNFNKKDNYANPVSFTGAFAYYRLFEALVRKAGLYDKLNDLPASYATYSAALSLLRYIEKSYATDEAKLFLKKESGPVYAEALSVCLRLDRMHPGAGYLEQAFLIGEKSKASVITASLEEKAFMSAPGAAGQGQLQQLNNLKYKIARLNVKTEATTDSSQLAALTREKESDELQLLRLQKELEQDGEYYRVKYGDVSPGIHDLQGELRRNQALVSLFSAGGTLHVFVVTRDGLRHVAIDSLGALQRDVESWLAELKNTGGGRRFRGGALGTRLYNRLVQPIQTAAAGTSEWVVVPDGIFALLPFESLYADATGQQWLVETTTISYRFSSRLLGENTNSPKTEGILSFAPFGNAGADSFPRLPASREEISGLQGASYIDGQATKERFLSTINHFPIVHLATHAVSSMDNAAASYIAFYPAKRNAIEDRLFLEELYGLNLRKTRLVIISACETGQGEVAPQEGVISLARAFAYAGCGSTINSLWKADDKATSVILRGFYTYLRKGETKARALQLAKMDYLKSDAIEKSPAFWAHLVLTGDSSALYNQSPTWWWVGLGSTLVVAVYLFSLYWARRRSKKDIFSTAP